MTADYKTLVEKAAKNQERLQVLVKRLATLDASKELSLKGYEVFADPKGTYGGEIVADSYGVANRIKEMLRESIESEIRQLSRELSEMFSEPLKTPQSVEQPEPGNGELMLAEATK